jgi:TonB family protein
VAWAAPAAASATKIAISNGGGLRFIQARDRMSRLTSHGNSSGQEWVSDNCRVMVAPSVAKPNPSAADNSHAAENFVIDCVSNQEMKQRPVTLSVYAAIVAVCVLPALASGQVSTPRKLNDVKPVYPRESLQAGDEGTVLLELSITASGTVEEARILWSGCQRLDKAALTAVRKWRYEQVRLNGKPLSFKVMTEVPFKLPTAFKSRAGRTNACRRKEAPKPTF